MTWQQVVANSPYLTAIVLIVLITSVARVIFVCWSRFLRHMNIRKHGWPPPHLDADGDSVELNSKIFGGGSS